MMPMNAALILIWVATLGTAEAVPTLPGGSHSQFVYNYF